MVLGILVVLVALVVLSLVGILVTGLLFDLVKRRWDCMFYFMEYVDGDRLGLSIWGCTTQHCMQFRWIPEREI